MHLTNASSNYHTNEAGLAPATVQTSNLLERCTFIPWKDKQAGIASHALQENN